MSAVVNSTVLCTNCHRATEDLNGYIRCHACRLAWYVLGGTRRRARYYSKSETDVLEV